MGKDDLVLKLHAVMLFFVGHYVPQLADLIYEGNKVAGRDRIINLKGFMVSSPFLPPKKGTCIAWSFDLIKLAKPASNNN